MRGGLSILNIGLNDFYLNEGYLVSWKAEQPLSVIGLLNWFMLTYTFRCT